MDDRVRAFEPPEVERIAVARDGDRLVASRREEGHEGGADEPLRAGHRDPERLRAAVREDVGGGRGVAVGEHALEPPADHAFPFSHAYFPRAAFDEVVELGHWICARKDEGFIALGSQAPLSPPANGTFRDVELRALSPRNVWLCELGTRAQWRDFGSFTRAIGDSADVVCLHLVNP